MKKIVRKLTDNINNSEEFIRLVDQLRQDETFTREQAERIFHSLFPENTVGLDGHNRSQIIDYMVTCQIRRVNAAKFSGSTVDVKSRFYQAIQKRSSIPATDKI